MKNIRFSYNNNKFKISASTWNDKFDGSYSVPNIQDYFEYILKKHEKSIHNPSVRICANKTEKIMKLLGSTKNRITKDMVKTYHILKLQK